MSLSDKAVSGIKYGPIDHGHVIQMLENINKYIDAGDLENAKSAIHSYISDLTQGENKGFEDNDTETNLDISDPAGKLTPDNTDDLYTKPEDEEHFGEEQAAGLTDLLKGLKDDPKDERW